MFKISKWEDFEYSLRWVYNNVKTCYVSNRTIFVYIEPNGYWIEYGLDPDGWISLAIIDFSEKHKFNLPCMSIIDGIKQVEERVLTKE
jgi:hypothetical protein